MDTGSIQTMGAPLRMLKQLRSYQMRHLRLYLRRRANRKSKELQLKADRTHLIADKDILVFSTLRNEHKRLPYFLKHYREMGANHFLIVDNDSDDGSYEYLLEQPDVSLWRTNSSYKGSRYGVDWLNHLQSKYGHEHWTLVVDPDELLIYPFCDTRSLRALTDWLDASEVKSFGTMLLDLYSKEPLNDLSYQPGDNPMDVTPWFDTGNLMITKNPKFGNLWIQGGVRARVFFKDHPKNAPALNKTPLVKWHRKYTYVSSTHTLLPRGLNLTYDEWGGERPSGILLHTKFLDTVTTKAEEELDRKEHYAGGREYRAYAQALSQNNELWCKWSEKYINWRQLELLGLMSKGNWA